MKNLPVSMVAVYHQHGVVMVIMTAETTQMKLTVVSISICRGIPSNVFVDVRTFRKKMGLMGVDPHL